MQPIEHKIAEKIGYIVLDSELVIQAHNETVSNWLGYPANTTLVGQMITDVLLELIGVESELQDRETVASFVLPKVWRVDINGQERFLTFNFEPHEQTDILVTVDDVSEYVQLEGHLRQERNEFYLTLQKLQKTQESLASAENELRRKNQELQNRLDEMATINLINQTLSTVPDLQTVLGIVARQITLLFKARSTGIALLQERSEKLQVIAYYEPSPQTMSSPLGLHIPIDNNESTQYVIKHRSSLIVPSAQTNPLTATLHNVMEERQTTCLMIIPLLARGEILGTIGVDLADTERVFTPTEATLGETIAGQIAGVIENARLFSLEQDAKEMAIAANSALNKTHDELKRLYDKLYDELAFAYEIQQGLLPPNLPDWVELDVVCHNQPAREVGGDFYYYHAYPPTEAGLHRYAFTVADVAGKGVSAALLMAASLAQFEATLDQPFTPAERLVYLDRTISHYTQYRQQNCALSYIELETDDRETYQLHITNAGGIPAYIKRRTGKVEMPEIGGFALGQRLGAEFGYQTAHYHLQSGDLVVLVSDGVIEAMNKDGEMFGFERFYQALSIGPHEQATQLLNFINQQIINFVRGAEPHDDLTVVIIRV